MYPIKKTYSSDTANIIVLDTETGDKIRSLRFMPNMRFRGKEYGEIHFGIMNGILGTTGFKEVYVETGVVPIVDPNAGLHEHPDIDVCITPGRGDCPVDLLVKSRLWCMIPRGHRPHISALTTKAFDVICNHPHGWGQQILSFITVEGLDKLIEPEPVIAEIQEWIQAAFGYGMDGLTLDLLDIR